MAIYVEGDILKLDTQTAIVHQCHRMGTDAGGITSAIHTRYPYSDIYALRHDPTYVIPAYGNIVVSKPLDPKDGPPVISFLSKHSGGLPSATGGDSAPMRLEAFKTCLTNLGKWILENNIQMVAFPHMIACGMSGGNWVDYKASITEFAKGVEGCTVLIVELPDQTDYSAANLDAQYERAKRANEAVQATANTVVEARADNVSDDSMQVESDTVADASDGSDKQLPELETVTPAEIPVEPVQASLMPTPLEAAQIQNIISTCRVDAPVQRVPEPEQRVPEPERKITENTPYHGVTRASTYVQDSDSDDDDDYDTTSQRRCVIM